MFQEYIFLKPLLKLSVLNDQESAENLEWVCLQHNQIDEKKKIKSRSLCG